MIRLIAVFFLIFVCVSGLANVNPLITLTGDENAYLENLGSISMCVDPDWMPYEHVDEQGNFTGIAADLIDLIAERLSVPFVLHPTADWAETLRCSREGKCLIIPFLNQTPAREEWLIFTDPLFIDPNVLVTREEHPYISNLADVGNKTIVFPVGTSMEEMVRQDYPNLIILNTETEIEAFQMVSRREADMTLRSLTIAAYTIRKAGFFNLKIAGQPADPKYTNHLRIGILKDEMMLQSILNKAIATITPLDREEIVNRHVYIRIETPVNYRLVISVAGTLSTMLLIFLYWGLRFKKLNKERHIMLDTIQTQVWYVVDDYTYGYVNQAHADFCGHQVSQMAFKKIDDLLPPEAAHLMRQHNREVFQSGKSTRSEEWIPKANGEVRLLSILRAPRLNKAGKGVEYIVCSAEDITEEKILGKKLQFSITLQELIAEISASFINANTENLDEKIDHMLKRCGEFLEVDRTFLFQISADEELMSNTHEWCASGIEPVKDYVQDFPVKNVPMIAKIIKSRQMLFVPDVDNLPEEASAEKAELQKQQVKSVLVLPLVKNEDLLGYFGFDSVKDRRDLDETQVELLRILGNTLADALKKNQIEKEIREARVHADRANQVKSEFLANMSHEIRTPLNAIIGFGDLLTNTSLTDQQQDFLTKIIHSGGALLGIINDVLDFSKIEAGKMQIEKIPFDLKETIKKVEDIIGVKAHEKGIELAVSVEDDVPTWIMGDPLRLNQVLINLGTNAVKFSFSGSVIIKVSLLKKTGSSCILQFTVSDQGIGMTQEHIAQLFQAFSQADSSTTRKFGGTGLGLAISKRLVCLMGGEIWVKSELDQGSTFFFTGEFEWIPSPDGQAVLSTERSSKTFESSSDLGIQSIHGASVLLAEDNEINQDMLKEILQRFGLRVTIAKDGKETVEKIQRESFDLVLMDVQMPVMGGYEATRLIRQQDRFRRLPIVAMTAHAMQGAKEECLNAGMNDYISKPIDFHALKSILLKWIEPSQKHVSPHTKKLEKRADGKSILPNTIYGIDLNLGLEYSGHDEKILAQILKGVAERYSSLPDEIVRFLKDEKREEALFAIHKWKGTLGSVGATTLHKILSKLEKTLIDHQEKTIDHPSIMELTDQMIFEFKKTRDDLLAWIESARFDSEDRPTIKQAEIHQRELLKKLQALRQMLISHDIRALDHFDTIKDHLMTLFSQETRELGALIQELEYDKAMRLLDQIEKMMYQLVDEKPEE